MYIKPSCCFEHLIQMYGKVSAIGAKREVTVGIFVVTQVPVLQIVHVTVVAMVNVRGGNVSANRDSRVQTAASVHKELSVTKVSENCY